MVSFSTLVSLAIATFIVAALPVVLYKLTRAHFGFERRATILGVAVFALFAMVIERALHGFVLGNDVTSNLLQNPVAFVVYGTLAAGICEETGRFLAMKWLISREPSALEKAGSGLGYGIGHGGAEAWLVGVFVQMQWIMYAVLANDNTLDAHFANAPVEAVARIHMVLATLSPISAFIFVVERATAFAFQLGFSALMWQMLRERSRHALGVLIAAHALVGLPAALFQARLIPLLAADVVYLVLGVIVTIALVRYYRGAR